MEVESALVSHPSVAEAAVIGIAHEIKGQALAAFVTPRGGITADDALVDTLKKHVASTIGPIARPDAIYFTAELPKTRSAKIMRRLLRDIAEGRGLGDTTTLTDPAVVAEIRRSTRTRRASSSARRAAEDGSAARGRPRRSLRGRWRREGRRGQRA